MNAASGAVTAWRHRGALARGSVVALLAVVGLLMLVVAPLAAIQQEGSINGAGLPDGARPFLAIYQDAAAVNTVNPFVLMAIHENETNFSRSTLPGVRSGVNQYGGCCAGPMQFSITGAATTQLGGSGGTLTHRRNHE